MFAGTGTEKKASRAITEADTFTRVGGGGLG
jgi:hypothetical protein